VWLLDSGDWGVLARAEVSLEFCQILDFLLDFQGKMIKN